MPTNHRPFRYAWSHQGRLHRSMVRVANGVLGVLPTQLKYGVGHQIRKKRLPYNLVEGATVVQIGAPYDTLRAGRSRAAYFGFAAGAAGHLVVVEPLAASVERFERFAADHLSCTTDVIQSAVWSESGALELHVDRRHPATNFSDGTVAYDDERAGDFDTVTVRKDTLDALLGELDVRPDMVSITTNWAEAEILAGMTDLIAGGLQYICLALGEDSQDYRELMSGIGYRFLGYDDRGATYERI